MEEKMERWQFLISDSVIGPVLNGVRKNCRGAWCGFGDGPAMPAHVRDYLGFTHERKLYTNEPMEVFKPLLEGASEVTMLKSKPGYLRGIVQVPASQAPKKPKAIDKRIRAIRCLDDLLEYFGADDVQGLQRRVYKDTACGASIAIQPKGEKWRFSGEDWRDVTAIEAFSVQTIVEGSDAEINGPNWQLPVRVREVDQWMQEMDELAEEAWKEANESCCAICGTELTAETEAEFKEPNGDITVICKECDEDIKNG